MENTANEKPDNKWLNVHIIATITRLLCRELTFQNEYLRRENKILKSKINKRLSFTDDERKILVDAITGATITSSTVTRSIKAGLEIITEQILNKHVDKNNPVKHLFFQHLLWQTTSRL